MNSRGEDVAQLGQMADVERGVVEQLVRERTFGPIGLLGIFVELHAKMFFEERGESDARAVEQLRGEHRVENAFRPKSAEVVEQAQIEIAAVHDEMLRREALPEGLEIQRAPGHRRGRCFPPTKNCSRQTRVR